MALKHWMHQQINRVPLVNTLLERQRRRDEFRLERALLQNAHYTTCKRRSIIHFSVHKSATQYVKSILSRCAAENGMHHVRMNDYAFVQTGMPYLHNLSADELAEYHHVFRTHGYLYSVFSGMLEGLPDLEKYHLVLMVRDPRDALTSEYFSLAHSHQPPSAQEKRQAFMQRRKKAREFGIDHYVLSEAERVRLSYERYLDLLVPHKNVYVTKYEDMIAGFESWLDRLLEHCELPISAKLRRALIEESRATRPEQEDVNQHIRQVTPGDHRRKLTVETIEKLNAIFADVLAGFRFLCMPSSRQGGGNGHDD